MFLWKSVVNIFDRSFLLSLALIGLVVGPIATAIVALGLMLGVLPVFGVFLSRAMSLIILQYIATYTIYESNPEIYKGDKLFKSSAIVILLF